jgi:hypothetical protein
MAIYDGGQSSLSFTFSGVMQWDQYPVISLLGMKYFLEALPQNKVRQKNAGNSSEVAFKWITTTAPKTSLH